MAPIFHPIRSTINQSCKRFPALHVIPSSFDWFALLSRGSLVLVEAIWAREGDMHGQVPGWIDKAISCHKFKIVVVFSTTKTIIMWTLHFLWTVVVLNELLVDRCCQISPLLEFLQLWSYAIPCHEFKIVVAFSTWQQKQLSCGLCTFFRP